MNYGFVYIWFDRKHNRYYIGSHWGKIEDKYICSSNWMRDAYNRRKQDFKRKIISIVISNRKQLLLEEYKWLSMIKTEELGKRYYNLTQYHPGHWTTDDNKILEVGKKISVSNKGRFTGDKNPFYGKKHTEKTRKIIKEKRKLQTDTEETKQKKSNSLKGSKNGFYGKKHKEETTSVISNKIKLLWQNDNYRAMMLEKRKVKHT